MSNLDVLEQIELSELILSVDDACAAADRYNATQALASFTITPAERESLHITHVAA